MGNRHWDDDLMGSTRGMYQVSDLPVIVQLPITSTVIGTFHKKEDEGLAFTTVPIAPPMRRIDSVLGAFEHCSALEDEGFEEEAERLWAAFVKFHYIEVEVTEH
jgi:hypothetical protein